MASAAITGITNAFDPVAARTSHGESNSPTKPPPETVKLVD